MGKLRENQLKLCTVAHLSDILNFISGVKSCLITRARPSTYLEALIALEAVLDTLPAAHLVSSDSSGIERHNLLFDLVLIHRGNLGTGERGNVIYQDYNVAF